jgi:hypothetical protein
MSIATLGESYVEDPEDRSRDYESPSMGFPSDAEKLGARLMGVLKDREGTWFLPVDSEHARVFTDEDEFSIGTSLRAGAQGIEVQGRMGMGTALILAVKPDGRVIQGTAYDPSRVEIFLTTPLPTS